MDDIFLRILGGEIPSEKIYEDELVFAILDINPHNKGHALVIPKEKYRNIYDIPENILCAMMTAVKKLVPAIQKATNAEGFNLGMNNETVAGQEVMHAHLHIVPRFTDDNVYKPARHTSYEDNEMRELGAEIRKNMSS